MALEASSLALCLNIVAMQVNTTPTLGCVGPRSSHGVLLFFLIEQHQLQLEEIDSYTIERSS